jgi:hypothetical protein
VLLATSVVALADDDAANQLAAAVPLAWRYGVRAAASLRWPSPYRGRARCCR